MINVNKLIDDYIKLVPGAEYRTDEKMRDHTSFKIGGKVSVFFVPKTTEELRAAVKACRNNGVKPLVIGNGTNLLVSDDALDIAVIKTCALDEITLTGDCEITAFAGASLARIANFACENGLAGFEFAHGIPGTVGGAVSMNAGAYGGEMKDVVIKTEILTYDGETKCFTGEEHDFGYRRSAFSDTDMIAVSVTLRLQKGDKAEIRARMNELYAKRTGSQPLNYPSAGSTFKRPVGGYAAALIDSAGLKGYSIGGAQVSEKHAGFVINKGGATFDDVIRIIDYIRNKVGDCSGITLEPEVKIIR